MSGGPCQTICVTVEDYSQDFSALQPDYLFYLLVELERLVAIEYIKVIISLSMCSTVVSGHNIETTEI